MPRARKKAVRTSWRSLGLLPPSSAAMSPRAGSIESIESATSDINNAIRATNSAVGLNLGSPVPRNLVLQFPWSRGYNRGIEVGSEFIGSRGFRDVANERHGAGAAPAAQSRRPLSRASFSGAALCALPDHRGHPGGGAAAHHDLHVHGAALRDGHPIAGGILYQRSGAADQPLQ